MRREDGTYVLDESGHRIIYYYYRCAYCGLFWQIGECPDYTGDIEGDSFTIPGWNFGTDEDGNTIDWTIKIATDENGELLVETGRFHVNLAVDLGIEGEYIGTAFYLDEESIEDFNTLFGEGGTKSEGIKIGGVTFTDFGCVDDLDDANFMYLLIFVDDDGETHFVLCATATGDTVGTATIHIEWEADR